LPVYEVVFIYSAVFFAVIKGLAQVRHRESERVREVHDLCCRCTRGDILFYILCKGHNPRLTKTVYRHGTLCDRERLSDLEVGGAVIKSVPYVLKDL
jgi:uncharacterized phosphosugar-binding protein